MTPLLGRELRLCGVHKQDVRDASCGSCRFALDWNLWHRVCPCGAPAVGYRTLQAEAPVEFFCDEHVQGIEAIR